MQYALQRIYKNLMMSHCSIHVDCTVTDVYTYITPINGLKTTFRLHYLPSVIILQQLSYLQAVRRAVRKEFRQRDCHSITVDTIVSRAQLGIRTFYQYFKAKDDVMKYAMQILMDVFAEELLKNHALKIEQVTVVYFKF